MTAVKKVFGRFIGDKAFYGMILSIAIPMMIQNGITNFVNLLDNIMVGQLGTESMSGVAIANQLIFVFNLCVFGGISGAGIFCAQFFGDPFDPDPAHTDTGTDRIDTGIFTADSDLGSFACFAGDAHDFHGSVVDLAYFSFKKFHHEFRSASGNDQTRSRSIDIHFEQQRIDM